MATNQKPAFRTTTTLIGIQRQLEAQLGRTPVHDPNTTLNTKYGIIPEVLPTVGLIPRVLYFGIGIGGCRNVDSGNLSEPNEVPADNMDLYTPLPFRVVPASQDLTPTERLAYRLRREETYGGTTYIAYYLKVIDFTDATVRFTKTVPDPLDATKLIEVPYTLDYTKLTPTPPLPDTNGVITDPSKNVNVTVSVKLPLTGAEVVEAVNVIYDGDLRRARISELGMYTGEDRVVSATDWSNATFNYTEAAFAQLAVHHTFNGDDVSTIGNALSYKFRFSKADTLLIA